MDGASQPDTQRLADMEKIIQIRLSNRYPERNIMIMTINSVRIAMFGKIGRDSKWHFTIIPPEFRDNRMLAFLQQHLMRYHSASLSRIPEDVIDTAVHNRSPIPVHRTTPPSD